MARLRKTFFALGANLGDPHSTFERALEQISIQVGVVDQVSNYYSTSPLKSPDPLAQEQPDYLNGVLSCSTDREPLWILDTILKIETDLGRDRSSEVRWGPRMLDIDLLAIDQEVIESERLTLPHPELHRRDFVLVPFEEIAPDYFHPLEKKTIRELLQEYRALGLPTHIKAAKT